MRRFHSLFLFPILSCIFILWQAPTSLLAHTFTIDVICAHTAPLNQGKTSACWAFASASLLETEWLNEKKGDTLRLSPMYVLRQKYLAQFDACCRSHGKSAITDGSLGHTFLQVWSTKGLMPLEAYDGLGKGEEDYDHTYLLQELRRLAQKAVKSGHPGRYRRKAVALLNQEMGPVARTFFYRGQKYTPYSFADSLNLSATDYVELTSFVRYPFYSSFVLDVPDNWERASYYNLPLDTLVEVVCRALYHGYTAVWDGDVSEEGYDAEEGVAEWLAAPLTPEERQKCFDCHETTDDHMMHIIGIAHDEKGKLYFVMKNSYGDTGSQKGLLYMSQAYFKAKTIAIMLNRKCLDFVGLSMDG